MALQASPFPNCCVAGLHAVGWTLILPCFWCLERTIAVCKSTTLERTRRAEQECYLHPLTVFFGSITFFLLFLVTAPLALLGLLLWAPLQACRRPFRYYAEQQEALKGGEVAGKASFGFASANLCLLPDGLARFNNLGHTQQRASAIGQRIVQGVCRPNIRIFVDSPSSCGTLSASNAVVPEPPANPRPDGEPASASESNSHVVHIPAPLLNSNQNSNPQEGADPPPLPHGVRRQDGVPWQVSSMFPLNVDVLCLEEVFDKRAAKKLIKALKPAFGHILYDVGVYACQPPCRCSHFKFFNSGLFVASRFPVLEAQFHWFPNSGGEDALAAKGLLSTKMLVGQNKKGKNVIGYFNCTHLHAPEGQGEIRCEQLNMVTKWIGDFQASYSDPEEEVVFDVLCGDFNFDNCSPDDSLEQNHCLFEEYRDPCRAGPRKEKPWVIGTLLEQPTLYEDDVNSPENLQRTLETEDLRKQYISPPVPAEGSPLVYPEPGQPWIGRRIDYILYRESSISEQCRTEVEEVTFITQLAGLTDHIPVGLRLNVTTDVENHDQ